MRDFTITLAGAIGGALLAVAFIYVVAAQGLLPINDRQMQTYLMTHPDLAEAMLARNEQLTDDNHQAAMADALKSVNPGAFFDPEIAYVVGPPDAKKTLVEFYDYNCPYCRASVKAVINYTIAHQKDTRIAFIEFPIKGPGSTIAARAALAARLQPEHYLDYHYILMNENAEVDANVLFADAAKVKLNVEKLKADMQRPEITRAMNDSLALAHKVHINATPTFIVNGVIHEGAVDDASLAALMNGKAA